MIKEHKKDFLKISVSAVLFLCAVIISHTLKITNPFILIPIYALPYLTVGYGIIKKAFFNITHGNFFDECFLMSVASVGAFCISKYEEAVFVILFYQIGELFSDIATGNSSRSIEALVKLMPEYADIFDGSGFHRVSPNKVNIGDIIVVHPGEKVPLDGVIIKGESDIDVSAITGETNPSSVGVSSNVISGSLNLTGDIYIKVTNTYKNSTVSKILDIVKNSAEKKTESEKFITKFSRFYTPVVCGIAVFFGIFIPVIRLISGIRPQWISFITRALTFLVISCPCAIVISIPLTFISGIGIMSKKGILVKGSTFIDGLSKINTLILDKTGTVTKGKFDVVGIHPTEGVSEKALIELAALCENSSNHPIAKSIKSFYGKEINQTAISDVTEIHGKGMKVTFLGKNLYAGNMKLMNDIGIKDIENTEATNVYVAIDSRYLGYIELADTPKSDSMEAIREIKSEYGINTVMLTGDKKEIAEKIAKTVQIDRVMAELLPKDKSNEIEAIKLSLGKTKTAVFVGDGINDAPALTVADVGISMGGMGNEVAIEASDIVIMKDSLIKVYEAISISKATVKTAKQNIVFTLSLKLVFLLLSSLGIIGMGLGTFADVGVLILVIINSLRLLYIK